jgi:hypothetical protein
VAPAATAREHGPVRTLLLLVLLPLPLRRLRLGVKRGCGAFLPAVGARGTVERPS